MVSSSHIFWVFPTKFSSPLLISRFSHSLLQVPLWGKHFVVLEMLYVERFGFPWVFLPLANDARRRCFSPVFPNTCHLFCLSWCMTISNRNRMEKCLMWVFFILLIIIMLLFSIWGNTFLRFRMIGCGLSSSNENCLRAGSKSAPGMVANANSSAENSTLISSLSLRSSLSLSILALLLSTYKNSFSPCKWNVYILSEWKKFGKTNIKCILGSIAC